MAKDTGPSMEKLLARMKELEETQATLQLALDEKDKKIIALEAKTEAAGEVAMTMLGRQVAERYIGKRKVEVKTFNAKKKEYEVSEQEIDMYEYLIDLAPNQGEAIHVNNIPFLHNSVATVDLNTLRDLKERISRGWWHEAQINGNQESKFRRPTRSITVSGKSGARLS